MASVRRVGHVVSRYVRWLFNSPVIAGMVCGWYTCQSIFMFVKPHPDDGYGYLDIVIVLVWVFIAYQGIQTKKRRRRSNGTWTTFTGGRGAIVTGLGTGTRTGGRAGIATIGDAVPSKGTSLPVVNVNEPFIGYRLARLRIIADKPELWAAYRPYKLAIDDTAICLSHSSEAMVGVLRALGRSHAPARDCTCGFYAVRDRASLPFNGIVSSDGLLVVLEVNLYGRYIEHEFGWRAQQQRIMAMELLGRCFLCGDPAVGLLRYDHGRIPVCHHDHPHTTTRLYGQLITPVDLANQLGVEVGFARGSQD